MLMWMPTLVAPRPAPAAKVEKRVNALQQQPTSQSGRTSLVLRNIPNNISRQGLMELLDAAGFKGCYDFLYVPVDFKRGANLGYAFVNLINGLQGERFARHFQGFDAWPATFSSKKKTETQWNTAQQSIEDHAERYRNSPLLHPSVPEEWRPLLLCGGVPVAFPPPTRVLQKPRGRMARRFLGNSHSH
jgi:hypothetical protein